MNSAHAFTHTMIRDGLTYYLTDAQLLSTLLGLPEERAHKILESVNLETTAQMSAAELQHAAGITERQARTIAAAAAYGRRIFPEIAGESPSETKKINCPEDVMNVLRQCPDHRTQEELHVLLLTITNSVISQHMVYRGNVNSSIIRPAEIIRPAILAAAPAIIISHNHPSGDPTPSAADITTTKDIQKAAALMGINLLDHVVTAPDGRFVSMKEQQMLDDVKVIHEDARH